MRLSLRLPALLAVLGIGSCTTLDQKYGDNKVYQETRDLSVKTARTVAAATSTERA